MDSREQGKQNLWCPWLGHCTKCVSSRRSWHSVHLSSGVCGTAASAPSPASVDDTDVVDDTCREPDDRRPPFDPEELGECWLERLAERCGGGCGGEPPAERGEPGGSVSVTDMSAAIGEGPDPLAPDTGGDPAARPSGDPAEPFVSGAGL